MKQLIIVFFFVIVSNSLFAQEKETNWGFGFSNGYYRRIVEHENNLINKPMYEFIIAKYDYFFLRPEIRYKTNSGFWSLRLDDINRGHTYTQNSISQTNFIEYGNVGLTISGNRILKKWNNAMLIAGLSLGYSYKSFEGTVFSYHNKEQRHTLNIDFLPRYSYSISKHFQLEFAPEKRLAELASINEEFSSLYNQWRELNNYQYLMVLNGYSIGLNIIYYF